MKYMTWIRARRETSELQRFQSLAELRRSITSGPSVPLRSVCAIKATRCKCHNCCHAHCHASIATGSHPAPKSKESIQRASHPIPSPSPSSQEEEPARHGCKAPLDTAPSTAMIQLRWVARLATVARTGPLDRLAGGAQLVDAHVAPAAARLPLGAQIRRVPH